MSKRRISWAIFGAALLLATTRFAAVVTPTIGEPPTIATSAEVEPLWRFGFVGDTQLGQALIPTIFARLAQERVEFVLHLGDIVDEAGDDAEWDNVMLEARRHRLRLMPVVGNHDRLRDRDDTGEARFREYFPHLPGTFYHFRHRGLNFVMLNSERSLMSGSEQARFLDWQLTHHAGPTIVCLHRPVFTCGARDWPNQWLRRYWLHSALVERDVVAVLAGHHHYYDRSRPLDGITYVVSGGGSPKLYDAEQPSAQTASFHAGRNHFGIVDVYADHVETRVVDLSGEELDRFALELPATKHAPGSALNRWGTELPPLDTLPQFAPDVLEADARSGRPLPRPW